MSEKVPANNHNKRERVAKLRDTDGHYDDSLQDLATREGTYRDSLRDEGITGKPADRLADEYSDETLGKIEAEKVKWVDELTGLRNKNALLEESKQLLAMEQRKGHNSSFLMMDFDHFKEVNDMYGHGAGDVALTTLAHIIKDAVRSSDIVYRYGGEEFMVFLPNTASHVAHDVAEKIRTAVETSTITIPGENDSEIELQKTVSIGCVGTDQLSEAEVNTDNPEQIMELADKALYASKQNGRNVVTMYSPAPSPT